MSRVLAALLAIDLMGLATATYYTAGSYAFEGYYLNYPLYEYFPSRLSVIISLAELGLGVALLMMTTSNPRMLSKVLKASLLASMPLIVLSGLTISAAFSSGRLTLSGGRDDSYVIQVAAARYFLMGINPYKVNYSSLLLSEAAVYKMTFIYRAGPPPYAASNIVGFVHTLDYPAFSFLYYVPAVLLRLPGNVWDATVMGVALAVLYWRLRPGGRALFPAIAAASAFYLLAEPTFFDPVTGIAAPLIVAVAFYDNPLLAGAMIGLAASYRQYGLAALITYAPYIARRRGKEAALRAVGGAAATAGAVNLPYLLEAPSTFIRDLLLPGFERFDRLGLGLSSLQYLGLVLTRGVQDIMVVAALIVAAYASYRFDVKWLWIAMPGVAFLLYPRPLNDYWIWFFYLGLIALVVYEGDKIDIFMAKSISAVSEAAAIAGVLAIVPLEAPGLLKVAVPLVAAAEVAVVLYWLRYSRRPEPLAEMGAILVAGFAGVTYLVRPSAVVTKVLIVVTPMTISSRPTRLSLAVPRPVDFYSFAHRMIQVPAALVVANYGPMAVPTNLTPSSVVPWPQGLPIWATVAAVALLIAVYIMWRDRSLPWLIAAMAVLPVLVYATLSLLEAVIFIVVAAAAVMVKLIEDGRGHLSLQRVVHHS